MTEREKTIELLAQTIAPRLYKFCGDRPEEMGFPIYDTKAEVEDHLARQFDPVGYWLDKSREIAESVVRIVEAGGLSFDVIDLDAMCKAAAKERPDVAPDGTQASLDALVP